LHYELWNRFKGVDFEHVPLDALGLPPSRAHFHSSSGGPTLARVFRDVGVARGSVVIDLGSGKGGAALTLCRLGFAEVIGVEWSPVLIATARRNAGRLGARGVRFVEADAGLFDGYDQATHIYMYNPFPCPVVAQVLERLTESLRRAPRQLAMVYRNPLCHDAIMATGVFIAEPERRPDHHAWRVYRTIRP
jgi:SAM-dependent methyltransferase